MTVSATKQNKKMFLAPKDLIYVGIFAALYFVVSAISMVGLINPVLFLPALALVVLANSITMMVFFRKVPRLGGLLLLGAIIGLFMTLSGHAAVSLPLIVLVSLIAELCRYFSAGHGSFAEMLAYAFFSLWVIGPVVPVFYMPDAYFAHMNAVMADRYPGFGDALAKIMSPGVVIGFEVIVFIIGIVAAFAANRLLRRYLSGSGVL